MGRIILTTFLLAFYLFLQAQTPPIIYIAGDGSGDYNCDGISDQIEINQALDSVAANPSFTTVYLKGNFNYIIDEPVIISSNTIFTGDSTAVLSLKDSAAWWTNCKPVIGQKMAANWDPWGNAGDTIYNVEIYGFEIGGGIQFEPCGSTYIPLIHFYNPFNVSIHDMNLHDSYWDIVRLTSPVFGTAINSEVYNNDIKDSGHEGICFVAVTNIEAYNNTIYSTRTNCGIRAKDTDTLTFYNNTIGNSMSKNPSGYTGILVENEYAPMGYAEIYNNLVYGKNGGIHIGGNEGIYPIGTRKNVHVHHNIIFKINDATTTGTNFDMDGGIKINGYQNTIVEHNVIEGGTSDGIVYEGSSGGTAGYQTIVRNNIIINNEGYGISNEEPSVHTFISNNNLVYNNLAGNYFNTTSTDDINSDPLFASTHSTLNNWHHVVASYDNASETYKIYVDGIEKANRTIPGFGTIGVNTHYLYLGAYRGIAHWYEGNQDELAVWNRALTSTEVSLLFNGGTPPNILTTLPTDLQLYLKMENNWNDLSGNTYNAIDSTAGFTSNAISGNYAGLFTGNDAVLYPDTLSTTNGITISVWVNHTGLNDEYQTILNKGSQGNNDHIWLYFRKESIYLELGNGTNRYNLEANIINPWEMDYHVKSEYGRWTGIQWVMDPATSPCVDNGDPLTDYLNEPAPNGYRANIGVFGNTTEASKSLITSISDVTDSSLLLYPNPSRNYVFVSDEFIDFNFEIISSTGQVVKRGKLSSTKINLQMFKAGVYILKIKGRESGTIKTIRLVKI